MYIELEHLLAVVAALKELGDLLPLSPKAIPSFVRTFSVINSSDSILA